MPPKKKKIKGVKKRIHYIITVSYEFYNWDPNEPTDKRVERHMMYIDEILRYSQMSYPTPGGDDDEETPYNVNVTELLGID